MLLEHEAELELLGGGAQHLGCCRRDFRSDAVSRQNDNMHGGSLTSRRR
jgi:hypothetical protein